MLTLCRIEYDYRHVSLALSINPENRPADFRTASRFGQVPVMLRLLVLGRPGRGICRELAAHCQLAS